MTVVPFRLLMPAEADDPVSIKFMLEDLAKSGLIPEDIHAFPIASNQLAMTGAYCIPYPDGRMFRVRHDRKDDKYIQPPKTRGVWWKHGHNPDDARDLPEIWIIEGEKKAAAFMKKFPNTFAFGIGGCNSALETISGLRQRLLPDLSRAIRPNQRVNVIFDADIMTKFQVQGAALDLKTVLEQTHTELHIYCPPEQKGVDDWIVSNPQAKLVDLTEVKSEDLHVARLKLFKQERIVYNDDGIPLPIWSNIHFLLKNLYKNRIRNDRYFGVTLDGEPMDLEALETEVILKIQTEFMRAAPEGRITNALRAVVTSFKTNVLQEFIKIIKWDGQHRLETKGSELFIGDNQKVTEEWFRLLMTGMYARIMFPGCKFDIVPILIGPQGIGKTTFFEDLATFEGKMLYGSLTEFSSESDNKNVGEVDLFRQSVIVDLAEGAVFDRRKNKTDLTKHRLTQVEDTCRALYSQNVVHVPRGFIFVGTANRRDIANDSTGTRRFNFLSVTKIIKLSYYEKLQILAEIHSKWEQISNTNWYEPHVTREDIVVPEELQHVESVQEIINYQYRSHDDFATDLMELIQSGNIAEYQKYPGCFFISAPWIKLKFEGMYNNLNRHTISTMMRNLEMSPTFGYTIEFNAKVQKHLVKFKDQNMELNYSMNITNSLNLLTGYKLTPKKRK